MEKNEVKTFVKKHKKAIAITAIAAVGGTAWFVLTKQKPNWKFNDVGPDWSEEAGKALRLSRADNRNAKGKMCGFIDQVPVSALGKFGEEVKKVFDVTDAAKVRVAFLDQELCDN